MSEKKWHPLLLSHSFYPSASPNKGDASVTVTQKTLKASRSSSHAGINQRDFYGELTSPFKNFILHIKSSIGLCNILCVCL